MPSQPTSKDRLSESTIHSALEELPGWTLEDGKLHREFVFRDFREAFGFMATIATAAEAMNHHPEWSNVYKTVVVDLTTHDASGITELDLHLAREMSARATRV